MCPDRAQMCWMRCVLDVFPAYQECYSAEHRYVPIEYLSLAALY